MTNTSYLSASVEATRLRYVEDKEDFFHQADLAACRALDVANACRFWAPYMSAHWLGADKFIVAISHSRRSFSEAHLLANERAFTSYELLTPQVLYVRCVPPSEHRAQPERFVLEQVAMAFFPF